MLGLLLAKKGAGPDLVFKQGAGRSLPPVAVLFCGSFGKRA